MDLLHPAHRVQLHHLHRLFVAKIREGRVVEGDVAVLADAHADDVHALRQQRAVAAALGLGVRGLTVQVVHTSEGDLGKQPVPQEVPEALGRVGGQADVLVHVEGVDAGEVHRGIGGQGGQELVLGGGGGEDHPDHGLFRQQRPDPGGHVGGGPAAQLLPGLKGEDGQLVFDKGFHRASSFLEKILLKPPYYTKGPAVNKTTGKYEKRLVFPRIVQLFQSRRAARNSS